MNERGHALAARTALKTLRRPSKSLKTPQSPFFSLSYILQYTACSQNFGGSGVANIIVKSQVAKIVNQREILEKSAGVRGRILTKLASALQARLQVPNSPMLRGDWKHWIALLVGCLANLSLLAQSAPSELGLS